MPRQSRIKRRVGRFRPLVLLLAAVLLVPALLFLATMTDSWSWGDKCTSRLHLLGDITYKCQHLRAAFVVLGGLAAFGLMILAWERTGLMRIFEVPWFGIGEDVENVGTMESIVRAAVFVLFLWLCVAMAAVTWIGVTGGLTTAGATPPGGPPQQPGPRPTGNPAPPTFEQTQKILAVLEQIQRDLGQWDPKREPTTAAAITAILGEVRDANGLLRQHEQHLAALDGIRKKVDAWDASKIPSIEALVSILGQVNTNLNQLKAQLARHEPHLAFLEPIYQALREGGRTGGRDECADGVLVAFAGRAAEITIGRAASSSQGQERFRAVTTRPIFFDVDSPRLSAWAKQELSWLLMEADGKDLIVAIHGSADPQGTTERNARLAQLRADAIDNFLHSISPSVRTYKKTWEGDGCEPKSEPYKRVTTIRMLQPCR